MTFGLPVNLPRFSQVPVYQPTRNGWVNCWESCAPTVHAGIRTQACWSLQHGGALLLRHLLQTLGRSLSAITWRATIDFFQDNVYTLTETCKKWYTMTLYDFIKCLFICVFAIPTTLFHQWVTHKINSISKIFIIIPLYHYLFLFLNIIDLTFNHICCARYYGLFTLTSPYFLLLSLLLLNHDKVNVIIIAVTSFTISMTIINEWNSENLVRSKWTFGL